MNNIRDDSALRALSSMRGLRGAPELPPLRRETQSLGQQMLNAPVGINGLKAMYIYIYMLKLCLFLEVIYLDSSIEYSL